MHRTKYAAYSSFLFFRCLLLLLFVILAVLNALQKYAGNSYTFPLLGLRALRNLAAENLSNQKLLTTAGAVVGSLTSQMCIRTWMLS